MGLIDALKDPQFRSDVYNGVRDTAGRTIAGAIGAPVDMAENVVNLGLAGTGWVGHETSGQGSEYTPGLISHAVGGSEWIGDRMRDAGLVSDQRNPVAEFLGGLVQPGGTGASHVAASLPVLSDMTRGADAIGTLGGMAGVLWRKGTEYSRGAIESGKGSGTIDIGDVTEAQRRALAGHGEEAATNVVRLTDDMVKKLHDKRVVEEGYTPDEIVNYMRQALRKDSNVVRDPSKSRQHPALEGQSVIDPVTGRRYTPTMPLYSDGQAYYPASVFPDGLPPRKK